MNISEIKSKHPKHWRNSSAIRILAADAVHAAASGHQGMPIGMADVATVLFQNHLKFDAKNPDWADRDRFIFSWAWLNAHIFTFASDRLRRHDNGRN